MYVKYVRTWYTRNRSFVQGIRRNSMSGISASRLPRKTRVAHATACSSVWGCSVSVNPSLQRTTQLQGMRFFATCFSAKFNTSLHFAVGFVVFEICRLVLVRIFFKSGWIARLLFAGSKGFWFLCLSHPLLFFFFFFLFRKSRENVFVFNILVVRVKLHDTSNKKSNVFKCLVV